MKKTTTATTTSVKKADLVARATELGLQFNSKTTVPQLVKLIADKEAELAKETAKKAKTKPATTDIKTPEKITPDRQPVLDALIKAGYDIQTWNHIAKPQPNLVSVRVGKHTLAEVYFGRKDIRVSTRSKYLEGTDIQFTLIKNYVDATIQGFTYDDGKKIVDICNLAKKWETDTKAAKALAKKTAKEKE